MIKFERYMELNWASDVIHQDDAHSYKFIFQTLYPNSIVIVENIVGGGSLVYIKFKSEADEAEFIMRESNGI